MPEDAELIAVLNECLAEIDLIPGDSKFEAFDTKIAEMRPEVSLEFLR